MSDTRQPRDWPCGRECECHHRDQAQQQQQAIFEFAFAAVFTLHAQQVCYGWKVDNASNATTQQMHEQRHAGQHAKREKKRSEKGHVLFLDHRRRVSTTARHQFTHRAIVRFVGERE